MLEEQWELALPGKDQIFAPGFGPGMVPALAIVPVPAPLPMPA